MAWQDTMTPIVRSLIFDLTAPYVYGCDRLEELIVISSVLVMQEVDFSVTYTSDVGASIITPDPESDADFVALVCLRTACLISQGEHRDAAKKAISVKDGPAFVDTKQRAKHLGMIAEDACSSYTRVKTNYQIGDGTLGRAIVGPYASGHGDVRTFGYDSRG